MSSIRLILLRTFNLSLGRFGFFSRLLRKALLKLLITKDASRRYVASSKYFDVKELG